MALTDQNQNQQTQPKPAGKGAGRTTSATHLAVAASYSVSDQRKFGIDVSGLVEVVAELVAVPAPARLMQIIHSKSNINVGQTDEATDITKSDVKGDPGGTPTPG